MKSLILPFLFIFFNVEAQSLPDSIVITENRFEAGGLLGMVSNQPNALASTVGYLFVKEQDEYVERDKHACCLPIKQLKELFDHPEKGYVMIDGYKVDTSWLTDIDKLAPLVREKTIPANMVRDLMKNINSPEDKSIRLSRFDIDTAAVKANPEKMLQLADNRLQYEWNKQQLSFIYPLLTNIENYQKELDEYVEQGSYGGMHAGKTQFVITCYTDGRVVNRVVSRKAASGFKSPWSDENGRQIFDYYIDNVVSKMVSAMDEDILPPLTGDSLLKWIVNGILEKNGDTLDLLRKITPDPAQRLPRQS